MTEMILTTNKHVSGNPKYGIVFKDAKIVSSNFEGMPNKYYSDTDFG